MSKRRRGFEPVPATVTAAMIGGLRGEGYSVREIALAADRPPGVISILDALDWVSPATEDAVALAVRRLHAPDLAPSG